MTSMGRWQNAERAYLVPSMMGKAYRSSESPALLLPSDMKDKSRVSLRTVHAVVGHLSQPHDLDHVGLSFGSGPPGNSVNYLILCDYFLAA